MNNESAGSATDMQPDGPIFIVGMNGSGTTMLMDSLGRHSRVYGIKRETRMMPYIIRSAAELGDLRDDAVFLKVWDMVRNIPAITFVNDGAAPPLPDDWRDYPRRLDTVFDHVFGYLAGQAGKPIWCEKTPQHVQHLTLLAEVFPNARFIHIIRDGRACAASFHRRWRRSPDLTMYRWKNVVRVGRTQGRELGGRYFEVKYEELTRDPEIWMREICLFLGLAFEPTVLESRNPQSGNDGEEGRIGPRKSSWRDYFSRSKGRRLEAISGAYLQELGYSLNYSEKGGSADLPRWRMKFLRVKDAVWLFFLQIVRKFGGAKKPWKRILTQPLESIRQAKINDF